MDTITGSKMLDSFEKYNSVLDYGTSVQVIPSVIDLCIGSIPSIDLNCDSTPIQIGSNKASNDSSDVEVPSEEWLASPNHTSNDEC